MRFRLLVRATQVLLAVEVLAFTISCLPGVRGQEGFDPLLDGWLQGGAYVTAAVLCALRPIASPDDRGVWTWLAAALAARALAFVVFLSVVREMDPIPYPSVADAGWVAMCVLVLIALVTLARSEFSRVSTSLLLDGLVGALATSALALALLYGTLVARTESGTATDVVVTNLAYPILDVLLLLVILGVLVAFAWRPPRVVWLLGAAVAAFAVVDSVFLYQVTAGTFAPGGLISALSLIATAAIAFVAWVPPGERGTGRAAALPGLVIPSVFAFVCLGLLIYATEHDVPATAVGLAAGGLVLGVVRATLTLQDFQRLAAELRVARDDAERASRAKSEFVSGMSHELRTPLNSVLGFAQLIELDAPDATQRSYARRIIGAGRHLVAMIDDLLDVSRLEQGELRPVVEDVAVAAVVREALDLTEPLVSERGLLLETDLPPDDLQARADFRRLRQVLINLISNAVKYNREGGRIVVSAGRPRAGTIRLSVSDTGAGIAPEDRDKLFRRFERLGAGASGTGLGLALSKGLVEEMGGAIDFDSEQGVGSTFWVDLAEAGRAAPADARPAQATGRPGGVLELSATILYIEDDPANVKVVEGIFAGQSRVRLMNAASGAEALELAREHLPDLVLLDLHLPDVAGEDVLRRLATAAVTTSIPVVVVSADATAATRERLLSAGAAGYMTKPLDVEAFTALVREVLTYPGAPAGPSR